METSRELFGVYADKNRNTLGLNPDAAVLSAFEAEAARVALEHPNEKVVTVAVVGDIKAGKSFILDKLISLVNEDATDGEQATEAPVARPKHAEAVEGIATTVNGHVYYVPQLFGMGRSGVLVDFEGRGGMDETPMGGAAEATADGAQEPRGCSRSGPCADDAGDDAGSIAFSQPDNNAGSDDEGPGPAAAGPMPRSHVVSTLFPKVAYCLADVIILVRSEGFADERFVTECLDFARAAYDNGRLRKARPPALWIVQNECPSGVRREDIREPGRVTAATVARLERDAGSRWAEIHGLFSSVTFALLPRFGRTMGPADARFKSTEAGRWMLDVLRFSIGTAPSDGLDYRAWLDRARTVVDAVADGQ